MLALGSGCKYRLPLAERFDCTETVINQLLADSYQNPISEWQVTSCILQSRLDISNTLRVSLSPITPRWDHLVAGKQAQGSH